MKRKALGKGIKAFLSEDLSILKEERYAEIDIDQIKPNPIQPRIKFNDRTIEELSESIKEAGVLQPILVTPEKDSYQIVTGERRWRAAQKIGLTKIPAIIRKIPPEKQLELSLIENLQREDLNPLEIAAAYNQLIEELKLTHQEVAERVGKDRTSITNYLRLLKLPKEVQQALSENKISMGHARSLLGVEDPNLQKFLCHQVIKRNLSVREVEKLVQKPKSKKEREIPLSDPNVVALEEELIKILGTKVSVRQTTRGGYIKIFYHSEEELGRICHLIKGKGY